MKIEEMATLLVLMAADEGLTVNELAAGSRLRPRTVHRRIADLRKAGAQIVAKRGRGGGVTLEDHLRTKIGMMPGKELRERLSSAMANDDPARFVDALVRRARSPAKVKAPQQPLVFLTGAEQAEQALEADLTCIWTAVQEERAIRARWRDQLLSLNPVRLVWKRGLIFLVYNDGGHLMARRAEDLWDVEAGKRTGNARKTVDPHELGNAIDRAPAEAKRLSLELYLSQGGVTRLHGTRPDLVSQIQACPLGLDYSRRGWFSVDDPEALVEEIATFLDQTRVCGPPRLKRRFEALSGRR